MAYILQSINEPTKYWTGTVLETRKTGWPDMGIFSTDISEARGFDTPADASEHADTIQVPVTIIEV